VPVQGLKLDLELTGQQQELQQPQLVAERHQQQQQPGMTAVMLTPLRRRASCWTCVLLSSC
jgi:hypothetical protein